MNEAVEKAKQDFANRLQELKVDADTKRKSLQDFYTILPNLKDPAIVISGLQTHIDALLDHIIDTHRFFDTEVLNYLIAFKIALNTCVQREGKPE